MFEVNYVLSMAGIGQISAIMTFLIQFSFILIILILNSHLTKLFKYEELLSLNSSNQFLPFQKNICISYFKYY